MRSSVTGLMRTSSGGAAEALHFFRTRLILDLSIFHHCVDRSGFFTKEHFLLVFCNGRVLMIVLVLTLINLAHI